MNYKSQVNYESQIIEDIYNGKPILKYAYLGDGAANFIRVINGNQYYYFRSELALIRANIAAIRHSFKDNIVVFGVGNGSKISYLLTQEKKLILVDISAELLRLAQERLSRSAVMINDSLECIDFRRFRDNTTFLLFGGTLCNFETWSDILTRLRGGCAKSNIIIGMEFGEEKNLQVGKKILDGYISTEGEDFLFYPLSLLGLSRDDGNVEIIFNHILHRIEFYFTFNSKGRVTWSTIIGTEPPARVLLNVSNKPTREEFFQAVQRLGLRRGQLDCSMGEISIIELCW